MDDVSSFAIGVVSSIAATGLTSLVWWLWVRLRQKDPLLSLLGLKRRQGITIFYGDITTERLLDVSAVAKWYRLSVQYGDMSSVLFLYSRLVRMCSSLRHAPGIDPAIPRGCIVTIGGPKWNKVTESLIGQMGSPLRFKRDVAAVVEKRKTHLVENQYPMGGEKQPDGTTKIRACGFVVCARSCYLDRETPSAVIIAGASTFGVLFATRFLLEMKASEIRSLAQRFRGDRRFGLLVEGTAYINPAGRVVRTEKPRLLSWIPEKDFLEAYTYAY